MDILSVVFTPSTSERGRSTKGVIVTTNLESAENRESIAGEYDEN